MTYNKLSWSARLAMCLLHAWVRPRVKALLDEIPNPSDEEIREYLSGNLCRCAGYADILRAVRLAQENRVSEAAAISRK
jgi:xanthine dehydrogenase iron-sulfur cluster and FAD-binding subunit A